MKSFFASLFALALFSCNEGGALAPSTHSSDGGDSNGSQASLSSSGTSSEAVPGQSSAIAFLSSSGDVVGEIPIGAGPVDMVASITYSVIIDEVASTMTAGFPECAEGNLITEWQTPDNYLLKDGQVFLWEEGACEARVYSGTSGEIFGTWTGTPSQVLAPGSTASDCILYEDPTPISMSLKISQTKATSMLRYPNWCWSTDIVARYAGSPARTVVADGCDSYRMTIDGKTATYSLLAYNPSIEEITLQLSFNGSTCKIVYPGNIPTAATCSKAWADFNASPDMSSQDVFYWHDWIAGPAMSAYGLCIANTGWTGGDGI